MDNPNANDVQSRTYLQAHRRCTLLDSLHGILDLVDAALRAPCDHVRIILCTKENKHVWRMSCVPMHLTHSTSHSISQGFCAYLVAEHGCTASQLQAGAHGRHPRLGRLPGQCRAMHAAEVTQSVRVRWVLLSTAICSISARLLTPHCED